MSSGTSSPRPRRAWSSWSRTCVAPTRTASTSSNGWGPRPRSRRRRSWRRFRPKIGYPNKWRDYSKLEIKKDDLVGNVMRAFAAREQIPAGKVGKPIDPEQWGMTPQTINAYYNPVRNEIVFPAAILQPPFFNLDADDAVELRRHRRGDRPRDGPRLRRSGPQLRRHRRAARLVDEAGRGRIQEARARCSSISSTSSSRCPA